jgi:hypothetical protein
MPENEEDVSFDVVPGSVGSAGAVVTPWAARRSAMADAARSRCMPLIREALSHVKVATLPRPLRAPVDSAAFERARARVLKGAGW